MEQFERALEAIEERLDGMVDVAEVARAAYMGEHHFRRVFATLAGMGVSEHVRRRRMTLAASDLRETADRVLEIAMRYGYTSADSFARAFRDVHGVTPSAAREPDVMLRSQSRLRIRISLEGMTDVRHRITELGSFHLVGRSTRVPLVHHGPNPVIADFVASIDPATTVALKQRNDVPPFGVLAVTDDVDDAYEEGSPLTYLHGVATSTDPSTAEDSIAVPAGTWLVLEPQDQSDEALQALWPYAVTEWLPSNRYELAPGPSIVSMRRRDDEPGLARELWLPVRIAAERTASS
jgi:AraC family transcriptional regulator